MSSDPQVLDRIARLAEDNATGELICTSDTFEVHVFLQRGRIAWATSSGRPLEFTRYLLQTAQIDVDVFREILESCRREKRPLGETLIAWGVATQDEVRAALRHQIESSLAVLDSGAAVESLFLKRSAQYADYDVELTFEPSALILAARSGPMPEVRPSRISPPTSVPPPSEAMISLRSALDGVLWTEEVRLSTSRSEPLRQSLAGRVAAAVVDHTIGDGASLVIMNAPARTLAGVALAPNRSLWCLVDGSVTVGAITAVLTSLSSTPAPVVVEPPNASSGGPWSVGKRRGDVEAVFEDFLACAPEVRAVFLTDPDQPDENVGAGRGDPSFGEELARIVELRTAACTSRDAPRESSPPAEADLEGTTSFRAMTIEAHCTLFATELVAGGHSLLVWVALDTRGSKGIGWGYLTSLGRTLARVLRREAT